MSSYLTLNELVELLHDAAVFSELSEARRVAVGQGIRRKLSSGIGATQVIADDAADESDGTELDAALVEQSRVTPWASRGTR